MTRIVVAIAALALGPGSLLSGQETVVTVRVVANDAKIIGTGVGGARVIIRDATTGEVLAAGVQEGGTGDTRRIMVEPRARGATVFDSEQGAEFITNLSLQAPTWVEVIGEGPLGFEHAMQRASKSVLLVPGEDVTGDGIVLVLHGYIVELLEPVVVARAEVHVVARVRGLCGCTFTSGGTWNADSIRVEARVYDGATLVREVPLVHTGEPSLFGGMVSLEDVPEGARLVVIASNPDRANFGRSQEKVVP